MFIFKMLRIQSCKEALRRGYMDVVQANGLATNGLARMELSHPAISFIYPKAKRLKS